MVEFSADAIVTEANQALLNLFHVPRTAIVGKHMSLFIGEEAFQRAWKELSRGRIYTETLQVSAADKTLNIDHTFMPIRDLSGKLLNVTLLAIHNPKS